MKSCCLGEFQGKTQNTAEQLNCKIWLLCPKTKFAPCTVVEMATAIVTLCFNKGHKGFEEVLQELGILPTKQLIALSEQRDQRRMKKMTARQIADSKSHCHSALNRASLEKSARKESEGTHAARKF